MPNRSNPPDTCLTPADVIPPSLLIDIRSLIDGARSRVAQTVNTELALLYWNIGNRINGEILGNERADYGGHVIDKLAVSLTADYGRGFNRASLFRMVQFVQRFPQIKIVAPLMRQLSWTHCIQMIAIDDPLKRDFYTQMGIQVQSGATSAGGIGMDLRLQRSTLTHFAGDTRMAQL